MDKISGSNTPPPIFRRLEESKEPEIKLDADFFKKALRKNVVSVPFSYKKGPLAKLKKMVTNEKNAPHDIG
jgi:hypothetical protein